VPIGIVGPDRHDVVFCGYLVKEPLDARPTELIDTAAVVGEAKDVGFEILATLFGLVERPGRGITGDQNAKVRCLETENYRGDVAFAPSLRKQEESMSWRQRSPLQVAQLPRVTGVTRQDRHTPVFQTGKGSLCRS
jgi:hypothetical protein